MNCALIWTDELTGYRFPPGHPLDPHRLELSMGLIRRMGLAGGEDLPVIEPRDALEEEVRAVHRPEYVDAVRRVSDDPSAPVDPAFGLGTRDVPVVPAMHQMARRIAGSTLSAAERVASGQSTRAFSIAGGLHHAHADRASGFCVYNDLAVAIEWLRREVGWRVMYIDYDAHHGDGVQSIFYENPEVLTVSLHESGAFLFPGTGFPEEVGNGDGYGFSANLPLHSDTGDDSFLESFDLVVPDLARMFDPDVIVLQCGCDAHLLDPLTHLRCSTRLFERLVRRVVDLAERHCEGRVVATGGGGYAIHQVVPRAWALTWAALSGQDAPDVLPTDWLKEASAEAEAELPTTLRDSAEAVPAGPGGDEARRSNAGTAQSLRRRVFPLLTGWGLGF